jgi:FKBP-type peptidyl-prolyl cis-trans isomerase
MRRSFRLLAAALSLIAAACLGDPAAPKIESTTFAPSLGVDLEASTRTGSGLYMRDIVVGTGTTAIAGARLNVHYSGALVSGFVFDDNVAGEDAPFTFVLGAGDVIKGWDEGLVGMRVGGRRQLIVPARLGYGSSGNGTIPPNSILVFTVELVSIG